MAIPSSFTLLIVLASIVGGIALVTVVILLLVRLSRGGGGGPVIASASLSQPGHFVLQIPPVPMSAPAAQGSEISIRYAVAFPFVKPFGQQTSRVFCLIVELIVDGQKMTFGHGGLHPSELLEFEGIMHGMTRFAPGSSSGTPTRYTATVLVKRFRTRPRTLEGMIQVGQGTMLESATLTLR